MRFLIGIGRAVSRDRGFNVSPLLVDSAGTAGKITSSSLLASHAFTTSKTSLLDTTLSQANPTKFVHLSSVIHKGKGGKSMAVKKSDGQNPARIGARTFLREFVQGRNVPWAIMRPGSNDDPITAESAATLRVLSLKHFVASSKDDKVAEGPAPFVQFADALSIIVSPNLVLLPRAVIEFNADAICPILHDTEASFDAESESEDEDDFSCEEGEEFEEDEEEDDNVDSDDE
eukprot:GILK01020354.1.p1 GENE.GILK01020354.1~~GILK01020354.1.p1  ORF type:complete len:231 (+),score=20.36 GILK01020354.1:3-695(+)